MAKERRATWFKLFTHSRALMDAMPNEAVGEALKAAMVYFQDGVVPSLSPMAAVLFAVLRESADESLEDYAHRVEGGKKGGRPPKQARTEDTAESEPAEQPPAEEPMEEPTPEEPAEEELTEEEPLPGGKNQTKPQVSTPSLPKPLQTEAEAEEEAEKEAEGEEEKEAEGDADAEAEKDASACAQPDRASAAEPACAQAQMPSHPSLAEIRRYGRTIGASQQDTISFYNCWSSLGWRHGGEPVTDWKAAFRDWTGGA